MTNIVIGYFGRLEPIKNLGNTIEALRDIPNITFEIVGDGSQRSHLETLSKMNQVNVTFSPHMNASELSKRIENWTFAIFPSLQEGHPKAVIETMIKGVPILGTPVLGIKDLLSHERGFLTKGTTIKDIREAITGLMNTDLTVVQSRMKRAQEFARLNFSLETIAESQRRSYSLLMGIDEN
jgi:glycosyltransferase involved in cell wall biosynthesis